MDLSEIAKKLDLFMSKHLIRNADELRRLCDVQFDSSIIGVVSFLFLYISANGFFEAIYVISVFQGEACKDVICLEISATRYFLNLNIYIVIFVRVKLICDSNFV